MKPDLHHAAPTWENQLWHARRLAADKGLAALNNPHAMTGRICRCGSCFCCAALHVYNELWAAEYSKTRPAPTAAPTTPLETAPLGAPNAPEVMP